MFHQSTQKKFWLLENSEKIAEIQSATNKSYIEEYNDICLSNNTPVPEEFLAYHDEKMLLIYYSKFVNEICRKFKPTVPMSVNGMSLIYFKRFYLNTSVMEFHPKDIAYLCVYLACKVDEYNVSIDQFMGQVKSSYDPMLQMFIIDNELLLLQKLHFHLTVHTLYRPLEGYLIDMKTRKNIIGIDHLEQHRPALESFLSNSMLTDVSLLYPPSQIVLAALSFAIGKQFFSYLKQIAEGKHLKQIIEKIEIIKDMVVNFKFPGKSEISAIEEKLRNCRDYENDPSSEEYHMRENTRKEVKEIQKKRKYQELSDMQNVEDIMLMSD